MELARRSRGTPRIANRFLKRVRDFAQVQGSGVITPEIAAEALERLEVDYLGLDSASTAASSPPSSRTMPEARWGWIPLPPPWGRRA